MRVVAEERLLNGIARVVGVFRNSNRVPKQRGAVIFIQAANFALERVGPAGAPVVLAAFLRVSIPAEE